MKDFDVIVVGARVAGSTTALLLSRAGLDVLLLDRARFPSDTLSSHQIQVPGVARLQRWGLLDRLAATGAPGVHEVRFDPGTRIMVGSFPSLDGVGALYSPRRTVLDALLLDAAVDAGVNVRTGFDVEDVLTDGHRVTGIRGRARGTASKLVQERAGLVIGADGKHSTIASAVRAEHYRERPTATVACYTYWSGLPVERGELYQRPGRTVAVFPTNDNQTMVYTTAPIAALAEFRDDTERAYLDTLSLCGDLVDRARAGTRTERFRLAPDQPNFFATPYGPGWALVGDAGHSLDSISAMGISNALRDAESVTAAIVGARSAGRPLDAFLAGYQRRRDAAAIPMYDFTARLAELRAPSTAPTLLYDAVADRPDELNRLVGVFAGIESPKRYFSTLNMIRLLGVRGAIRAARDR
jgi:2-polyprenyl-6-methoxyphenol hydroxylase-like FAD-dependent oxidoreductase